MWPFRRRHRGRHALGAAVTEIPSYVPPPVAAPPAPPAVPEPEPVSELPPAPRVELGFRDGSTAALAPGSEQAQALTDIASVLTQRD